MKNVSLWISSAIVLLPVGLIAQTAPAPPVNPSNDDSNVRPAVTEADLRIVQRARQILASPLQWNRTDTRVCPPEATTYSLYCALEKATIEVSGDFKHRGAVMQEARFVIDEVAPNAKSYPHRLMGYNNDPTTAFASIQKLFQLLEDRIRRRLAEESQAPK